MQTQNIQNIVCLCKFCFKLKISKFATNTLFNYNKIKYKIFFIKLFKQLVLNNNKVYVCCDLKSNFKVSWWAGDCVVLRRRGAEQTEATKMLKGRQRSAMRTKNLRSERRLRRPKHPKVKALAKRVCRLLHASVCSGQPFDY